MPSNLYEQKRRSEKFRPVLEKRRRELLRRLAAIENDFEQPRNQDDDDRAIERNNDEVLEELGQAGQKELAAIEAAIHRLEAGTFGICTRCGKEINERRLEAVPYTPCCQACAEK